MTKIPSKVKKKLNNAKKEIQKICDYYKVDIRPIDMHTIGLVSDNYVIDKYIENIEILNENQNI